MHWSSGLIALAVVGAPVFAQVSTANPPPVDARSIGRVGDGEVRNSLTAHVRGITQDQRGNMWFATDGEGLVRFDGKEFTYFTEKQGLPSNYVRTVQVDTEGTLWFTSRDGLGRFDGNAFTRVEGPTNGPTGADSFVARPPGPDALFFPGREGVFVYDGVALRYLQLPIDPADIKTRRERPWFNPYAVYSVSRDVDGNVWIGTETRGVCRWDRTTFTWFREVDLDKSPVRAVFKDSRGNAWFGNSGVGLFRFDGKELRNFGDDNNIGNRTWLQGSLIRIPGTIGDPHAIVEDSKGTLWIGAFDSGVWRYDGKAMTNFTMKDGLPTDSVSAIYEDRSGKLWFGTFKGVCTFDGKKFAVVGEVPKPENR